MSQGVDLAPMESAQRWMVARCLVHELSRCESDFPSFRSALQPCLSGARRQLLWPAPRHLPVGIAARRLPADRAPCAVTGRIHLVVGAPAGAFASLALRVDTTTL